MTKTVEIATAAVNRPLEVAVNRAAVMREALAEEKEQRAILKEYIKGHMIPGTDFGRIPETDKDTLLKPGAEKLTELYRCTAEYELVEKIEDWDKGFFHYMFRVRIVSRTSQLVLAEGFGSANSKESRYRWRNGERKCPHCGKAAIIKGKAEYGGGWICFDKKGGCKAKFSDNDQTIVGQQTGRVENNDIYTLVNTILKMAKKRALVDGAIALARCSDIFTQDMEDMSEPEKHAETITAKSTEGSANGKSEQIEVLGKKIDAAATIDELSLIWGSVPSNLQSLLKDRKDRRKAALPLHY